MTDARYPERWLHDRRVTRLSDAAHRSFVTSLTWSVSNRTDGIVAKEDVDTIPQFDARAIPSFVASGLWAATDDGAAWLITVYADSQSTREQLEAAEHARSLARDRQARRRARLRDGERDVTRDVASDEARDYTGQARQGQARPSVPATQVEKTTQLEEEQAHAREDDVPLCGAAGCDRPARRACRTCYPHARLELSLAAAS